MESMLTWLLDQGIALVALLVGIIALIQIYRLKKMASIVSSPTAVTAFVPPLQQTPHLIYDVNDDSKTHAIRNKKLVNHVELFFVNQGEVLYYDNLEFLRRNKRQEVEILAEKELEIFTDPRDQQKVERGEKLKISFEREIGESMSYEIKIFFQDQGGRQYFQLIQGKKGEAPRISDPQPEIKF